MRAPLRITLDTIRFSEYDANGFLGYQIDAYGEQDSGMSDVEALHAYGFASRALDPQVDENGDVIFGCLSLTIWEGSESFSIALHDARKIPILSTLKKGESLQYGPAGNFLRCHLDGRVSRFSTHDGTENGQTIFDEIGPGGYTCKTPWSVLRNDATGLHYECGAATLDMGQISGAPAPFSAFSSYADLQAHTVRILGSSIQFGVGTGALAVARAAPQLGVNSALASAIELLQVALAAIVAIPANSAAAGAVTAAGAAVATALSAISTAAPLLPSKSTTAT